MSFAFGGAIKFTSYQAFGEPPYAEKFVDWGYPAWFRFLVGGGEVVAAALLAVPRRRFVGAGILLVILVGAVLTHIVNQDPISQSVAAPLHLAFAGIVAWSYRPASLKAFWRSLPVARSNEVQTASEVVG